MDVMAIYYEDWMGYLDPRDAKRECELREAFSVQEFLDSVEEEYYGTQG